MQCWKLFCAVVLCFIMTIQCAYASQESQQFLTNMRDLMDLPSYSRLQDFDTRSDTTDDRQKYRAWLSDLSPWHQYSKRQFSAGLKPRQHAEHKKLVEAHRCEDAAKLEKIGFIGLYPQLSDIFSDESVNRIFDKYIIPQVSFSDRWCRAMRVLEPTAKKARRARKVIFEIVGKPGDIDTEGTFKNPSRTMIFGGWFIMERLALCDNYRPAIASMLKHFDEFAYAELGRASAAYLLSLAKKIGIETMDFDRKLDDAKKTVISVQMYRIEKAFRDYSITQALALLPYQSQACKIPVSGWPLSKLYP